MSYRFDLVKADGLHLYDGTGLWAAYLHDLDPAGCGGSRHPSIIPAGRPQLPLALAHLAWDLVTAGPGIRALGVCYRLAARRHLPVFLVRGGHP